MLNSGTPVSTHQNSSTAKAMTFFGLYTIKQDEVGVKLTFGKYHGPLLPGLGFAIPFIQNVRKTQASLQTIDLPNQQIVLNGNISVTISGTINFRVGNPRKAILEVQNYAYSVRQLALTTIADVLGTKTIEQVRSEKHKIAKEIEEIVAEMAVRWGLLDIDIRLTDAMFDESLLRAMMRETEAEKEASAIRIKANADLEVAQIFSKAAKTLASSPGSMTLRVLQTISDISNQKSTVVIPIPIDLLNSNANSSALTEEVTGLQDRMMKEVSKKLPPCSTVYEEEGLMKANCTHCGAKYNVTDILGREDFDVNCNVKGQQVRCKLCKTIFSLTD